MRLTLRTLLAYLDDILEPADARDLGQKIEESEFASGLVHRIRSVTRKLRLGAPKLAGKGMGLDANTVAEYLDNTLPQDRVPDFEKVCLESDVHLAEVASCHQILTLVLGEPADVDPALRERIRSLQARIDALGEEEPERTTAPLPPAPVAAPPVDHRDQDHDWDEASEMPTVTPASVQSAAPRSSIRLLPIVGTLVVTFLLALVALIAMGPLDDDHPILGEGGIFSHATPAETADTDDRGTTQLAGEEPDTKPAAPAAVGESTETTAPATTPAASSDALDTKKVAQPGAEPGTGAPGAAPARGHTFPVPPGAMKAGPDMEPPAAKTDLGTEESPPTLPSPDLPDGTLPGKRAAGDHSTTEPAEGAAKEPKPLARCMSNLHVLARFDPATETWLRLTANDPIPPRQELIALPTYRPRITFGSGVQLMLVGPVAVTLRDPGPDGVPGLVVHYGRVLATTDGAPNAALNIQIGARISRVGLPGLDSTLALDVQRYHQPGTNPEEKTAHWLIQAQAAAGRVTWQDQGAADATTLETGHLASMIGTGAPRVAADSPLPKWLDPKNLRPIDRDASEQLEPRLESNRPLTTSLLEQATNRLVEVRSLAIRSLCVLGTYDAFMTAFNSKAYRTFWPDLLFAVQLSVAQDPETATRVRTTFERLRGDQGRQLFRFLWGFSPQQLADGGAASLVEALMSPSMDIRVFAFENLNRIVEKTNSYQPEIEPNRQRRAILNWQRDLDQNEITHKTPPFEVPE